MSKPFFFTYLAQLEALGGVLPLAYKLVTIVYISKRLCGHQSLQRVLKAVVDAHNHLAAANAYLRSVVHLPIEQKSPHQLQS